MRQAIRFLKDNDLMLKYQTNFIKHPNHHNNGDILDCLNSALVQTKNFLETTLIGFDWCNTDEGTNFWRTLSEKFYKKIKNDRRNL